jgi:hypothetical protein
MHSFKVRTEQIVPSEILQYFVETAEDRRIVDQLKGPTPTILVGSRGVGKSFLIQVARQELENAFDETGIVPVYITFTQGALLQVSKDEDFYFWMLAKLLKAVLRAFKKYGILSPSFTIPGNPSATEERLDDAIAVYEQSWKQPNPAVTPHDLPDVDDLKDLLEDVCEESSTKGVYVFFDEAAHILRPSQQRQFFNLFRDLNSPYVNCNAAVYPGVTSYGPNFQATHDATLVPLERDVFSPDYVDTMRTIVEKQSDSQTTKMISHNLENFATLSLAADGNPRLLFKTMLQAGKLTSATVNETIRNYYRADIWQEHSLLTEKYPGFKRFIDWGRDFVEDRVLPDLKSKNDSYLNQDKKTTSYFWIHRDAPESARRALDLLCYTGIVKKLDEGIKATRSEIGTRYTVNRGCLLAMESAPASTAKQIVSSLTPKRMSEFGASHDAFDSLPDDVTQIAEDSVSEALLRQLKKPVKELELPTWLIDRMGEIGIHTIEDILSATDAQIQRAYYVGQVRSSYIKNEAQSAVFEYLSG